jgi:hypothetical protein
MAYFAELNSDNVVIRCVLISNEDCLDKNGVESEEVGISFCNSIFGESKWVQTSYTGRIRNTFAGPGMLYHEEKDVFVPQPPHIWYILDENNVWVSPLGIHPDTGEPLEDWQWRFLEVAYKLSPVYDDFLNVMAQQSGEQF